MSGTGFPHPAQRPVLGADCGSGQFSCHPTGQRRRSLGRQHRPARQIETDPPSSPEMPLVVGLDGSFYFKPESGGSYWLSPHDEIPSEPGDAAPDELSVAIAIDRFEKVMDVEVKRVSRKWAGLRSFAPDRLPVIGFDSAIPDFFWFAGQGGFGIQTSPAAAKLAGSLLGGSPLDKDLCAVDAALYAASRFT